MSTPLAAVTVELPHPVSGAELIGAVKTVVGDGDEYGYAPRFIQEHRFDNGDVYVIGQYSKYPYDQLLVSPTREKEGFRPEQPYDKVEVMTTSWPGSIFPVGYSEDAPVQSARHFAEQLKLHFDNPSGDSEDSSVWPQEIRVCAICERIVMVFGILRDEFHCPTDGKDVPTKMIAVTPVAE